MLLSRCTRCLSHFRHAALYYALTEVKEIIEEYLKVARTPDFTAKRRQLGIWIYLRTAKTNRRTMLEYTTSLAGSASIIIRTASPRLRLTFSCCFNFIVSSCLSCKLLLSGCLDMCLEERSQTLIEAETLLNTASAKNERRHITL
jgi:hypothetical protein